jgi:hypothetical protein
VSYTWSKDAVFGTTETTVRSRTRPTRRDHFGKALTLRDHRSRSTDLIFEDIVILRKKVHQSWWLETEQTLHSSVKCYLLSHRTKLDDDGYVVYAHSGALMPCLSKILVPQHRLAYTRFITSSHGLSVELLRHKRRGESRVPREWRLCRLCRRDVEDEEHVVLHCTGNEALVSLREAFLNDVRQLDPVTLAPRAFWPHLHGCTARSRIS